MSRRKQNLLYLATSFVMAVFLFLYATNSSYQKSATVGSNTSEIYTNTISSVPIKVEFDNKKYFASGFTPDVTVQLTSSNRLTLQKESQEAMRSFSVTADMTALKSGTHEVPLKVEGLPEGVTATLSPESINVTIGKRVKQTFEVETQEPSSIQLAEGYSISSITTADTSVEVITDEGTMAKIAKVVASLPSDETISENYSKSVSLKAVDAQGNYLPCIITPEETRLEIKVKKN